MNLKKLSDKELLELINTTSNLKTLEAAEQEWVNRVTKDDNMTKADYDRIMTDIDDVWRQG